MTLVRLRKRGQMTLPAKFRAALGIDDAKGAFLEARLAGEVVILSPRRTIIEQVADEVANEMARTAVTLDDLLEEVDRQREAYLKETYGDSA